MLLRRDVMRGAGLVALGSLSPFSALARGGAQGSNLAPPPPNFASNHNYFIYGGGQPIRGLKVTVEVSQAMVAPTGMSLQLNGYSPAGAGCVWQQYCMGIDPAHEARLGWSIENFPSKPYRWTLHNKYGLACGVDNPTEQTCKGNIFNQHGVVGQFPAITNQFPQGCKLIWELIEASDGTITGAKYTFVNAAGKKTPTGPQLIDTFKFAGSQDTIDAASMAPLLAFQLNLVGLNNGAHTQLSSGAGTITYEATTPLTPQGLQPSDTAAQKVSTEETSNIAYAQLSASPTQKISQAFNIASETRSLGNSACTTPVQGCPTGGPDVYDQAPRRPK